MGSMVLRLREIRVGRGLTLEQAAGLVGKAVSTVSRHEREEGINFLDLQMWCEAYGIDMAELLTGPHLLTAREKEVVYGLRRLSRGQMNAILTTMAVMVDDGRDGNGSDDEPDPDDNPPE